VTDDDETEITGFLGGVLTNTKQNNTIEKTGFFGQQMAMGIA